MCKKEIICAAQFVNIDTRSICRQNIIIMATAVLLKRGHRPIITSFQALGQQHGHLDLTLNEAQDTCSLIIRNSRVLYMHTN